MYVKKNKTVILEDFRVFTKMVIVEESGDEGEYTLQFKFCASGDIHLMRLSYLNADSSKSIKLLLKIFELIKNNSTKTSEQIYLRKKMIKIFLFR